MLKQELIEEVIENNDIVEVIGEYLPLKKVGKNYKALCPFHLEKTPSFYVSPEKQLYHCFGCGASGNIISFTMNYESLGFYDAVNKLAKRAGIKIEAEEHQDPNFLYYKALKFTKEYYRNYLFSEKGKEARNYLESRGFNKEAMEEFELGYVPQSPWEFLKEAKRLGFSEEMLKEIGVIREAGQELSLWMAGRIVFPIDNFAGKTVGFGGRVIREGVEPKYINSPETKFFKKGRILYRANKAKEYIRKQGALLVEGYFDVMRLHLAGIRNAVAPLGTSFTQDQATQLSRYSKRIWLVFDGDASGIKAARRALNVSLEASLHPRIVLLPPNTDPDILIREGKIDMFRKLMEEDFLDPIDFILKIEKPLTVEDKSNVLRDVRSLLELIQDEALKELYAVEFAKRMNIEKVVLLTPNERKGYTPSLATKPVPSKEEQFLSAMVRDNSCVKIAKNLLPLKYIKEDSLRKVFELFYKYVEKNYPLSMFFDEIAENLRNKVSAWALENKKISLEEFEEEVRKYVRKCKKEELMRKIEIAEMESKEEAIEPLIEELNRLVRDEKENK